MKNKNMEFKNKFEEIVVEYPSPDVCTYPEYKGKPYFGIKYLENENHIIGYGTYNPKVLSDFLKEYFMPRWIPVSEDLPKDIKPVQITWKNNDPETYYQDIKGKHFTGTAHYKDGKWYWYSDVTEDFLAEYGRCDRYEFDSAIEVVAWMPMPKPYETESEIEE